MPEALLAQVNIARLRADLQEPGMGNFLAALAAVNQLAREAPGFVWHLPSAESHGATAVRDGGAALFLNVSLWRSYEALHAFVYRSPHGAYLRRRNRWFAPTPGPTTALRWVAPEQRPAVEDALRRLHHLGTYGPAPEAFTMRRRFDPAGRPVQAAPPEYRRHAGRGP